MDTTYVKVLNLAIKVLSDRLITLLALLTSFTLGCWTMWEPCGNTSHFCRFRLSYCLFKGKDSP